LKNISIHKPGEPQIARTVLHLHRNQHFHGGYV